MASVGLSLFGLPTEEYLPLARGAEELGFHGVWLAEHTVAPETYHSVDPHRLHEPPVVSESSELSDLWVLCGALLAGTERLYVATGIYIAPLRHPLHTARAAITAAKLSGGVGRFKLGVGAGWMREEFAAFDSEFGNRFERLEESVDILGRACTGGAFSYQGAHYRHERLRLTREPQPVPVIMGGVAPGALRRAAAYADGWYNPGLTGLEECRRIARRIDELRRHNGRDSKPFTYYIRVGAKSDPELYEQAGFLDLVVPWEALWSAEERSQLSVDAKLARMSRLAERMTLRSAG
jgi:alkanesulfonate monooxygenase SsuD/methylene tetrahydromethanopterin reductase-like flavin-dependent oxidoreductase (luciferase family)